jgi:hypothetical protein
MNTKRIASRLAASTGLVGAVAAGAVLAGGAVVASDVTTEKAAAQPSVQAQLTTIQRQNIRAIKQLNYYSYYLSQIVPENTLVGVNSPTINQQRGVGGGWRTSALGNVEVTPEQLSPDIRNYYTWWAKYWYNAGAPQSQGNGLASVNRTAPGQYEVKFNAPDISGCSYVVSPGYYVANPEKYAIAQTYMNPDPATINVQTYEIKPYDPANAGQKGDVVAKDYPFHIYVNCGTVFNSPTPSAPPPAPTPPANVNPNGSTPAPTPTP